MEARKNYKHIKHFAKKKIVSPLENLELNEQI